MTSIRSEQSKQALNIFVLLINAAAMTFNFILLNPLGFLSMAAVIWYAFRIRNQGRVIRGKRERRELVKRDRARRNWADDVAALERSLLGETYYHDRSYLEKKSSPSPPPGSSGTP